MKFHVLTLFPDMIIQGLSQSIIGRAAENGLLSIEAVNIRDYTLDKHKKVDDYPYGGGAGMLMQAQPVYDAWKSVIEKIEPGAAANDSGRHPRTVYLTPQGQNFTQELAKELAKEEDLVLLCGHYEGIDERVLEEIVTDYVSIGDYVLTGGELPAMVMIDAIARMVPGVLNNEASGIHESFEGNLLEYPQYSRPEEWHGKRVPDVLLSGNQKNIDAWRREASVCRTRERRPDMYLQYEKLQRCLDYLKEQKLLHMDMIELINRGQARLVYAKKGNICLYDRASGIYFHTAETPEEGRSALHAMNEDAEVNGGVKLFVLHQDFMREQAEELLLAKELMSCYQAVYTRKEKLSITGLYRLDGKKQEGIAEIRPLTMEHMDIVTANYHTVDDADYIRDRIEKGWMFGAFIEGELAGFSGMHTEGGIGMLEVLPQYRGRYIGKALETYMINLSLERGMIPYGQVAEGNEVSRKLQESLGLCFSKTLVYWMEKM